MEETKDFSTRGLNEIVVSYLKDKILAGELKVGDKIIESDISNALNISRPPVREGIRALNEQGLLDFSPRKGNKVRDFTREELIEAFEIRTTIELQILYIIIEHRAAKKEDFNFLRRITEQISKVAKSKGTISEKNYKINVLDLKFHSHIWSLSKSAQRIKLSESLFLQLVMAMNTDLMTFGSLEEKAVQHELIIDALMEHDFLAVRDAFSNHLNSYLQTTVERLSKEEIRQFDYLTKSP